MYEFVNSRVLGAGLALCNRHVVGTICTLTPYPFFITTVWINPSIRVVYSFMQLFIPE